MNRKTSKKYKFYSDAGHGWLAVKVQDLVDLNIVEKITPYSYLRGKTAYLEEDLDLSTFVNALKEKNISHEIVTAKNYPYRAPIRSYDSYNHTFAVETIKS